jgi:hypothetical protein
METFLKIVKWFFIVLGVIFFILILLLIAFVIVDPFKLRPLVSSIVEIPFISSPISDSTTTEPSTSKDRHPLLTEQQEDTLEAMGINPATLPTEITPALEDCFTQKLGAERVSEIKAGSEATAVDYLKAKDCVQ